MAENNSRAEWLFAEDVVNSDRVVRVYAACEWDELSDDGKAWIRAIIVETVVRCADVAIDDVPDGATGSIAAEQALAATSIGDRILSQIGMVRT